MGQKNSALLAEGKTLEQVLEKRRRKAEKRGKKEETGAAAAATGGGSTDPRKKGKKSGHKNRGLRLEVTTFFPPRIWANIFSFMKTSDLSPTCRTKPYLARLCSLFDQHVGALVLRPHEDIFKELQYSLSKHPGLVYLDLRGISVGKDRSTHPGIRDAGASFLRDVLCYNRHLSTLLLCRNGIGVAGFRHLADGVSQNSVLEYLDLARNGGRDPGVEYLSEALRENTSIRRLNLRGNDISKEGASSLSFMLRRNKSLRVLSLRDNRLGNEGVLVLCEGMRENSALLQLDLHNNGIGDAGIIPLVQAIIDNPHPTPLLVLGLGFNQIGSRGLAAVQKLPHSVRVDMEGNPCMIGR